MEKAMTLRLSAEQAAELETVARADGMSVSEEVRVAIAERIERRRKDKKFQERLNRMLQENARVIERLSQ
jgi:hypothetical protein